MALAVTLAVRYVDVVVLVDATAVRRTRALVHICANRAAVVDVRIKVLGRAGRHIGVQVCRSRRAGGRAVVKVPVRVDVRRGRRTLVEIPVRIEIGAIDCAGRRAVHGLIDRAGRNVGVEVVVRRSAGRRVLIDVGQRPRLDIVIRVSVRRCGRAHVIVIVCRRRRAGRRVRVYIRVGVCAGGRAVGRGVS